MFIYSVLNGHLFVITCACSGTVVKMVSAWKLGYRGYCDLVDRGHGGMGLIPAQVKLHINILK